MKWKGFRPAYMIRQELHLTIWQRIRCMGSACPYRNVPHLYCDKCEQEVDDLYEWDDEQVCIDCIVKSLKKVEIE